MLNITPKKHLPEDVSLLWPGLPFFKRRRGDAFYYHAGRSVLAAVWARGWLSSV